MAETKVTERIISGTGVLRLPPLESAVRYYSVLVDVIRLPVDIDRSFKYSPFRQRFATVTALRDKYVIDEFFVNYTNCRYDYLINEPGQVLLALKCSHKQILSLLSNSGTPEASVIEEFSNLSMLWNELRFCCHSNTALKVSLYQDLYDECSDSYREKSPPPPPPPPTPSPANVPIQDISPPYEDGDDVTSKYPEDEYFEPEPPEFPQGQPCQKYQIVVCARANGAANPGCLDPRFVWGEISFIGIPPENPFVIVVTCRGLAEAPWQNCRETSVTEVLTSFSGGFVQGSVTYTITPI